MLAGALQRLLPEADVDGASFGYAQHLPPSECMLVAVDEPDATWEFLTRYRATGGQGSVILIATAPGAIAPERRARHGVTEVLAADGLGASLIPAVRQVIERRARACGSPQLRALVAQLAQCDTWLAAGQLAVRLPHRLNNPLAALLAEAELLTLDTLTPHQRESVQRILSLSHRLIEEVRTLEGAGGHMADAGPE